ncbi:rod-binding protein [Rhizobium sp. PAMB 3182]
MADGYSPDMTLDALRATDPAVTKVQDDIARMQLQRSAATARNAGQGFDVSLEQLRQLETEAGLDHVAQNANLGKVPETYRKFEAMVLQQFVQYMLPKESEQVYGSGNAGEIWKSMMAEQFANVLSKRGGIGIAEELYAKDRAKAQNNNSE